MTHIHTEYHTITHNYTQYDTFYTHIHTNCHILGWVTKKHTYIYISIYIYNKFIHSTQTSLRSKQKQIKTHNMTPSSFIHSKKKKFFNRKSNQIIFNHHSFIQNQIQKSIESSKSIEFTKSTKITKNRGTPLGTPKPTFSTFSSILTPTEKTAFFTHFRTLEIHSIHINLQKSIEIFNSNQSKSIQINSNQQKSIKNKKKFKKRRTYIGNSNKIQKTKKTFIFKTLQPHTGAFYAFPQNSQKVTQNTGFHTILQEFTRFHTRIRTNTHNTHNTHRDSHRNTHN